LFYSARREQDSLSNIYPQENTAQVNTPCVDELYRRLDEAAALSKENVKLRDALALLLPLKQDGSVSICQMQRQFHLGYFAASTIAEAVNASTARHAKGGQP